VTAVRSEYEHILAVRMVVKDWFPILGDQDRTSPAMRDLDFAEFRMEVADTPFEIGHDSGGVT